VGQAGFTITVVVLFNLLVPAGWRVGLLRVEDVAIGCGVSVVVGVLFWPRGAGSVVGSDLADAFRRGAAYLSQAVDWSLGLRRQAPDDGLAAFTAGSRLDDAMRGFLAEQGAKRLPKGDLWALIMGSMRLRLTANSVASLHEPGDGGWERRAPGPDGAGPDGAGPDGADSAAWLRRLTADLTGFYDGIATLVAPVHRNHEPERIAPPELPDAGGAGPSGDPAGGPDAARPPEHIRPNVLWVRENLRHLQEHAPAITEPAMRLAQLRRTPWWR
jgi:hypothetical protein